MMLFVTCLRQTSAGLNSFQKFSHLKFIPRRTFFKKGSGSSKLRPPSDFPFEIKDITYRNLIKPFIFTVCFSGGVFACAAIWQYEVMRKRARQFGRSVGSWLEFPSRKRDVLGRGQLSSLWNRQTDGQKVASVIIALNGIVFLMWRIPQLTPFMMRYFLSTPALRKSCLPMFLSTFSHFSFFHMAANMYVLYSFSTSSVAFFGKEQFVALYCSAGVVSSFASYAYKILMKSYGPSLGASGALLAILSSCCCQFPDSRISIIFLPFFTMSAGHAIKAIMALDFVGCVARWQMFDHAAHLGGAIYGIYYLYYGQQGIWSQREGLISSWHKIRGKP